MLDGLLADAAIAAGVDAMPAGVRLSATAAEVAGTVAVLLGPDASFVHGQVLFVDGGVEAQLRPDRFDPQRGSRSAPEVGGPADVHVLLDRPVARKDRRVVRRPGTGHRSGRRCRHAGS